MSLALSCTLHTFSACKHYTHSNGQLLYISKVESWLLEAWYGLQIGFIWLPYQILLKCERLWAGPMHIFSLNPISAPARIIHLCYLPGSCRHFDTVTLKTIPAAQITFLYSKQYSQLWAIISICISDRSLTLSMGKTKLINSPSNLLIHLSSSSE